MSLPVAPTGGRLSGNTVLTVHHEPNPHVVSPRSAAAAAASKVASPAAPGSTGSNASHDGAKHFGELDTKLQAADAAAGATPRSTIHLLVTDKSSADVTAAAAPLPAATPIWETILPGRRRLIMFAVMMGMFMAALDIMIVTIALPTIAAELNGFNLITWVISIYLLTNAAVMPLYGKFSDVFGRRNAFMFAALVFGLGSLLCAVANGINLLVAARAIQGIGGGGLQSMGMIIVGDLYAPKDRPQAMAIVAAVWSLSSVLGPVFGGLFTEYVSWRWIFYINLPVCVACLLVCFLVMGPIKNAQRKQPLDVIGSILIGGATACLILAITWGGDEYAWDSATILGLFGASFVLYVLFVLQELRHPAPLLRVTLFKHRNMILAFVIMFTFGIMLFGTFTYLPMYFQSVRGDGAIMSGIKLIPAVAGWQLTSIASGMYMTRTGKFFNFPIFGAALAVAMVGTMSVIGADTPYVYMGIIMWFYGMGMGAVLVSINSIVSLSVSQADMASAISAVTFARIIGGSIGVASLGSIFNNALTAYFVDNRINPAPCARSFAGPHCSPAFMHAFSIMCLTVIAPGTLTVLAVIGLDRKAKAIRAAKAAMRGNANAPAAGTSSDAGTPATSDISAEQGGDAHTISMDQLTMPLSPRSEAMRQQAAATLAATTDAIEAVEDDEEWWQGHRSRILSIDAMHV